MIRFVPWSEVGTITVSPGDNVVEVGAFELAEGADTLWVRMTNTGTPGPWPWSYGILSFKTEEGQPLGSIKAYNSFDGEVFRLGVGLAPSVRAGVLTFEPRGFNMAWINQGNSWSLQFEAQSGGGAVSSAYWNRDPDNGLITPKTSGDNLDMTPGWIKAKNLILTDGQGAPVEKEVPGYQQGHWVPAMSHGSADTPVSDRCVYSRIGNLVHLAAFMRGFTDRSGNIITFIGLPYSVSGVHSGAASSSYITRQVGGITLCYAQHADSRNRDELVFLSTSNSRSDAWDTPRYADIGDDAAAIYCAVSYLTSDTTWQPSNDAVVY